MVTIARILAVAAMLAAETVGLAAEPAAAPASAPTAAAPITVTGTQEDKKDPDQVVCRKETDTGSRIKATKVCMSRRQWAEQGREASRSISSLSGAQGTTQ